MKLPKMRSDAAELTGFTVVLAAVWTALVLQGYTNHIAYVVIAASLSCIAIALYVGNVTRLRPAAAFRVAIVAGLAVGVFSWLFLVVPL